jgi:hypothetical protein
MPHSQHLSVALGPISTTIQQTRRRAEREVDESKGHPDILPTHTNPSSKAEPENWNPSAPSAASRHWSAAAQRPT